MCVEADWPSSQTFLSSEQRAKVIAKDVGEAEGPDREQVGDDATDGIRKKDTPNKDMTKR